MRWSKPRKGWHKLNSDGGVSDDGKADCGGVIRNEEGEWIVGYTHKPQTSDCLQAEAWGLLRGLELGWQKGIKHLEVESDSKELIQLINDQKVRNFRIEPWMSIQRWVEAAWTLQFSHILREGNKCADNLVKLSRKQS